MSAAGKYRERIEISIPLPPVEDEGLGGFISGGNDTNMVWARVQIQAGSEQLRHGIIDAGQPYKITIRYAASVFSNAIITWNSVRMNVSSVVHNERKTETILYCNAIR